MEPATSFSTPFLVGPGQFVVSREPGAVLSTGPLGAGLAVSVYDWEAAAGGVLHALLPNSRLDRYRAEEQPGIFVDTGLAALLEAVRKLGVGRDRFVICLAGAGQFLDGGAEFDLGGQNRAAVEAVLTGAGLKIKAAAIEGPLNRALRLQISNGDVLVRVFPEEKEINLCQA